jgi:antitoxin HicB
MRYLYPCKIDGNEEDGDGFVVSYPDIPWAHTGGFTFKESLILAEDCLVVALSHYVDHGEELPTPSPFQDGQELLTVQPVIAAQLDLYTAMREQNISQAELAERLGISIAAAEKLLSLDYCTPLSQVNKALLAVGGRPAVENQAA